MIARRNITIEEILDMVALETPEPSHEALQRWCARYPQHRERLASYFATWAVQAELPEKVILDHEKIGYKLVAHALGILDRRDAARATSAAPATRLMVAAKELDLSEKDVAERCGLDEALVRKLDRRLIRVATVPVACLERLSAALAHGVDAIVKMLDGPPVAAAGARYKAKKKPRVVAQDFRDAIRSSTLGEDAKKKWIDAV